MRRNLSQWLAWQQSIHPQQIALGLERIQEMAARLRLERPGARVLSVAGTNGKGSTVAFAEAIARAAGYRVGAYTSPHLQRYNERIRIDGSALDDAALIAAFEAVEAVRAGMALTFFEFGTLAALWSMQRAGLDLAILEVGLGGRLDAVNAVDADAAIITTIDLDHTDWLGPDRDHIGREKAGILRPGRAAVIAEAHPPAGLLNEAERIGAQLLRAGQHYHYRVEPGGWHWQDAHTCLHLPAPRLRAPAQYANAAAAIAALRALQPAMTLTPAQIAAGVATATLPGRLQILPGAVELVLDVAHNRQAAEQLAQWLDAHPHPGPCLAVMAALADKDAAALACALARHIDAWHLAGLEPDGPRGQSAEALKQRLQAALPQARMHTHATVAQALAQARAQAQAQTRAGQHAGAHARVLIFGSFHTVAEALDALAGENNA